MNLQPVTGAAFTVTCIACGTLTRQRDGLFADLDGEPFRAYYCAPCANSIKFNTTPFKQENNHASE